MSLANVMWTMNPGYDWCHQDDMHMQTKIVQPMHTLHIWCMQELDSVIWHRPMLGGHDRCRPINAHTLKIMLVRLGCCWCNWKLSFTTCTQAMSNVCRPWMMLTSRCAHTTFHVCMPWPMPPYIGIYFLTIRAHTTSDACTLWLISAALSRCLQATNDVPQ